MCKDGKGRLWTTWAAGDKGKWDIWGSFLAEGKWSAAIRLTRGEGNSFGQKLAVDKTGTLWMTWQSAVKGNYEVLLAAITPDGLGKPLNVSRHPANDWEPAIAAADGPSLARAVRAAGKVQPVFVEDIGRLAENIRRVARDGDVVLTMGAGSIGNVAAQLG